MNTVTWAQASFLSHELKTKLNRLQIKSTTGGILVTATPTWGDPYRNCDHDPSINEECSCVTEYNQRNNKLKKELLQVTRNLIGPLTVSIHVMITDYPDDTLYTDTTGCSQTLYDTTTTVTSPLTQQVTKFHQAFNHPVGDHKLQTSNDTLQLRLNLIAEEFFELLTATVGEHKVKPVTEAYQQNITITKDSPRDPVETADALADMCFVIMGMALTYGLPLDEVLDEVYRSNMSKLDEHGNPIYREDGKIMKSSLYEPPRIRPILEAHNLVESDVCEK